MESPKLHAALLASPGLGHLIPVLELGKRLVDHHGLTVTVYLVRTSVSASASETQLIQSAVAHERLQFVELPPVDITSLVEPDAKVLTRVAALMREARRELKDAMLNCRPDIFIVDFFGAGLLDLADELNIPKYVYVTCSAWFLAVILYLPTLDKLVKGPYVDETEPFQIPGCRSLRPEDVIEPMGQRHDQQYVEFLKMGKEIPMGDGILANTWEDLELASLAALRGDQILSQIAKVPVHPIGPLVKPIGLRDETVDWLDNQPSESVILVSFGSGGTLSAEQIIELAWGLELSQHRFIWVVRPPVENTASGSYLSAGAGAGAGAGADDLSSYLPEGFLSRNNKVGLVVPRWAPQREILGHPSVGGFLSHCGWNSSLESIVSGIPMIAWPLFAEQHLNATMLTEELGVAICPELSSGKKVVKREEIRRVVRKIMEKEGNAVRDRVKILKESADKALSRAGSSRESLHQVIRKCELRRTEKNKTVS